jgi:hypothetical protein
LIGLAGNKVSLQFSKNLLIVFVKKVVFCDSWTRERYKNLFKQLLAIRDAQIKHELEELCVIFNCFDQKEKNIANVGS